MCSNIRCGFMKNHAIEGSHFVYINTCWEDLIHFERSLQLIALKIDRFWIVFAIDANAKYYYSISEKTRFWREFQFLKFCPGNFALGNEKYSRQATWFSIGAIRLQIGFMLIYLILYKSIKVTVRPLKMRIFKLIFFVEFLLNVQHEFENRL